MWKFSFKKVLSGDILTESWLQGQYRLIVLVSALIFVYIHSGFKSQQQLKEFGELQKELQDAQFILLSRDAEFTEKTRQSSIHKMLTEEGSKVKPSTKPVIRIQ
jgi:hypothetical protein